MQPAPLPTPPVLPPQSASMLKLYSTTPLPVNPPNPSSPYLHLRRSKANQKCRPSATVCAQGGGRTHVSIREYSMSVGPASSWHASGAYSVCIRMGKRKVISQHEAIWLRAELLVGSGVTLEQWIRNKQNRPDPTDRRQNANLIHQSTRSLSK